MASCTRESSSNTLELPPEFEDLEGLLQADLQAIVAMLTERARERLLLSRRQSERLQRTLRNGLTQVVNKAVEPLTAERR